MFDFFANVMYISIVAVGVVSLCVSVHSILMEFSR